MDIETTQRVPKHWPIVVASLWVGFGLTAVMLFYLLFRDRLHTTLRLWLISMGGISTVVCVIQLTTGPLIFTRDVVCDKCKRPQKLNRIPFFIGGTGAPQKCECGEDFEPAFLWKAAP